MTIWQLKNECLILIDVSTTSRGDLNSPIILKGKKLIDCLIPEPYILSVLLSPSADISKLTRLFSIFFL